MRKLLLVLAILMLTGCTMASKWTQAQVDCSADPGCLATAQSYAKMTQTVAQPWGPIAVGVAGSAVTYIALGFLGFKMKKEHNKK